MPEAVIVATARSPIGRAFKGSLTTIRPDDAVRQMAVAALAKVPQLDPADIADFMLGCGLPGGEQGFNMARVVAIMLGYDHVPGTTVTRYCSSSLQTTRMAFHAIKAGEGDVFLSGGVECVSRYANGSSDSWPDTQNPVFAAAKERTEARSGAGAPSLLPLASRLTHSTPPEMNTSPSPALIAWNAIRVDCSEDEQYRVIVAPGSESSPSITATTRARL